MTFPGYAMARVHFFLFFFHRKIQSDMASDLGAYFSQFSAGDFALKAMKTLVLKLIKCSK